MTLVVSSHFTSLVNGNVVGVPVYPPVRFNDKRTFQLFLSFAFPDDMQNNPLKATFQEREFQIMFTFSPEFEAATLKIPHKEYPSYGGIDGVGTAGRMPPRKQIIGFAKVRRVGIEKGTVLQAEIAKKNLHTKRGVGPTPSGLGGASTSANAMLSVKG
ncbi:hypothetical protein EDD18DRAFT_1100108 [Armillaria luteobubalina]|uniref:Uncharacterized protein n=1 Tax=Armillaria luteobubalina TaxID=153913 RepID=A0AA39QHS9_9AGAR|nr:hypothetical protein EDD18DRAFT_1100108 [Armillaria luteobubalina]